LFITGEREHAKQHYQMSLHLSRCIGDKWVEAIALNRLADITFISGSYAEGYELYIGLLTL